MPHTESDVISVFSL